MEIQNLKRRNSEYASFKSLLAANQCADQAQRERIHLCGRLVMKDHLHKESYARSCRKLRRRCYQERNYSKQRRLEQFPTQHMIRNHEQSVYSSTILTLLSNYDVPTILIKLLLPRVQESVAAKLDCREIHETIWEFLETFLIVNMLDEKLMNYTMIQEIWRYHWRFWEQKELRKMKAKNHCNQYLHLASK